MASQSKQTKGKTMTNLGKTKQEIIYELVLSLNQGDSYYVTEGAGASPRVKIAMYQYAELVDRHIIVEYDKDE